MVGGYNSLSNDLTSNKTGNDTLISGNGNDQLLGGDGNNLIVGGGGQDIIYGGNGNNQIYANTRIDFASALDSQKTATASGQKGSFIAVGDGNNIYGCDAANDSVWRKTA